MAIFPGSAIPSAVSDYEIDNSLRFNDDDAAYLSRTPGSDGNRKTWTFSCWFKKCKNTGAMRLMSTADDSTFIGFQYSSTEDILRIDSNANSNYTTAVYRDPSAWYHLVVSLDTTQSTTTARRRAWINGVEVSWSNADVPTLNGDSTFNYTSQAMSVGSRAGSEPFDGYIAECYFLDGTGVTDASDFGELDSDTNQWKPLDSDDVKDAVTFGTNGFYQKYNSTELADSFTDSSGGFTPTEDLTIDAMLVGGGGSGTHAQSGGGGGGGMITLDSFPVSVKTYGIVIGEGGKAANDTGNPGGSTIAFGETATGGGGGGINPGAGGAGANGGGGADYAPPTGAGGVGTAPSVVSSLATAFGGFNGGPGVSVGGAGGGGLTAIGGTGVSYNRGGAGGAGKQYNLDGNNYYWGGGGGGASYATAGTNLGNGGDGGIGGGGGGGTYSTVGGTGGTGGGSAINSGGDGTDDTTVGGSGGANTGGGGGGGRDATAAVGVGGNGGSGIVQIRYASATAKATGGTITTYTDGGTQYQVHTFTSSAGFPITAVGDVKNVRGANLDTTYTTINAFTSTGSDTWTCPAGVTSVKVLSVAGGAGGAGSDYGGGAGGGAGGLVYVPNYTVVPGVVYDLTVGAGGAGTLNTYGVSGGDSVFNVNAEGSGSTLTSKGGGGGYHSHGDGGYAGRPGGSGGGGGHWSGGSGGAETQTSESGDSGTYGFGNAGGSGNSGADGNYSGGGGGGAGAAGGNSSGSATATGGVGKDYSSVYGTGYGASGWFAGGGGGGASSSASAGGTGGGGAGATGGSTGTAATANTGGGGGGSYTGTGGSGGSGVIIIAWDGTKPGSSSIEFDGTGDYLTVIDSPYWDFGDNAWTAEFWVNPNTLPTKTVALAHSVDSNGYGWYITWDATNIEFFTNNNTSQFDVAHGFSIGKWSHVALSSNGTTLKAFVDGSEVASVSATTVQDDINTLRIGGIATGYVLDGYMDEIRISDSARYTAAFTPSTTQFTTDANTKLLIHSDWTGGLGADSSGNYNNFTATNLVATDQMVDTPTNNFATYNPLLKSYLATTFTEGNLVARAGSGWVAVPATFSVTSGKWYMEFVPTTTNSRFYVVGDNSSKFFDDGINPQEGDSAIGYHSDGNKSIDNTATSYGATWVSGDIIAIALNMDDSEVTFYKNNATQGTISFSGNITSASSVIPFAVGAWYGDTNTYANFGADSSFAAQKTAQGNQDGNGKGDFYYAPPSGYLALCTDNLSTPEIKLPGENFNTILWSGTGGNRAFTGVGFQPDFVWQKARDDTWNHSLYDSVRGVDKAILSDSTSGELDQDANGYLSSFDSDGFGTTAGSSNNNWWNDSTDTYVGWNWKAGTTFDPTTDGSIASATGKSNSTAGFSIVKYTAENAVKTIGHGLSQAPTLILQKTLVSGQWECYYLREDGSDGVIFLDQVGAGEAAGSGYWNDTNPTASVFTVGTGGGTGGGTDDHIAYCFHSVEGYSKIGIYTANNNADGPFIYTGFGPSFAMIKRTDSDAGGANWYIMDDKRPGYNVDNDILYANLNNVEGDTDLADLVSNGVKIRTADAGVNASGGTYLYMVFASHPFKHANAR